MLTADLCIQKFEKGRVMADRLTQTRHAHYVVLAERMLQIYQRGVGRTRQELHRSVEHLLEDEPDCEIRRMRAFCKLLDDAADFDTDRHGRCSALRMEVFSRASSMHPIRQEPGLLVGTLRSNAVADISAAVGRPWPEIEEQLYADVLSFQPLRRFAGYASGAALLSAYNVAQVQACLYRALSMRVEADADFKTVLRGVKLSGLMHTIHQGDCGGYVLELDGPASILRSTSRYGVQLARFLPWLLACQQWTATAKVRTPWNTTATLHLSHKDGLRGANQTAEAFDSKVEEGLARKFADGRDGWTAHREAVVLHEGQHTFIPDFAFRHDEDGLEVLLEIVGFWTPEYLADKRATLQRFGSHRILLAVPEASLKANVSAEDLRAADVIPYKTAIKADAVVEALERVRHQMRAARHNRALRRK